MNVPLSAVFGDSENRKTSISLMFPYCFVLLDNGLNSEIFSKEGDKTIGDVLKKLPGVRVEENGQAYQFSADGRNAEYHCQIPATRTDG